MKIIHLLAEYLYANKRLSLPGIGSFLVDPNIIIDTENNKKGQPLPTAQFEPPTSGMTIDPELVNYISQHSGKMKALALSDLESHIELALQFLNIGKPFVFEGIGTLSKREGGRYEFTPGNAITDKPKAIVIKDEKGDTKLVSKEKESVFARKEPKTSLQKPLIGVLLLIGLAAAIYAGYYISKKPKETTTAMQELVEPTPPVTATPAKPDTTTKKDSTVTATSTPTTPVVASPAPSSVEYKYVLEISNAKRIFPRYRQLKEYGWNVQVQTRDSIEFKLFMMMPATGADTTHILDSLRRETGRRVYIEQ